MTIISQRKLSSETKKRVAIHEAGHVTLNLLWNFPVRYAEICKIPEKDDVYKGVTQTDSFEIRDTQKSLLIKQLCVSFSGMIAEEIYLGKEIDWKIESQGSAHDFYRAQIEAFKFMKQEFYTDQLAPFLLKLTKDALTKNWHNCVLVIASRLFNQSNVSPEFIKVNIKTLYKLNQNTVDQIVEKTTWTV